MSPRWIALYTLLMGLIVLIPPWVWFFYRRRKRIEEALLLVILELFNGEHAKALSLLTRKPTMIDPPLSSFGYGRMVLIMLKDPDGYKRIYDQLSTDEKMTAVSEISLRMTSRMLLSKFVNSAKTLTVSRRTEIDCMLKSQQKV